MDISIGALTGTIQAGGLSPEQTEQMVTLVLRALDERNRRADQARSDTKVGAGEEREA